MWHVYRFTLYIFHSPLFDENYSAVDVVVAECKEEGVVDSTPLAISLAEACAEAPPYAAVRNSIIVCLTGSESPGSRCKW
jgi:hypothetical protein